MEIILKMILVLRNKKGLRQEDVAKSLGLSTSTYSKMEAGRINISLTRFFVIADLLNMDPYALLDVAEFKAAAIELDKVIACYNACSQKIINEQSRLIKAYEKKK